MYTQNPMPAVDYREPIAIVGIACRFPGGCNNPKAFWTLLYEGRDAVDAIPPARWQMTAVGPLENLPPAADYPGAFLTGDLSRFDADFFRISPREAEKLDPQQRIMLEVACEALERAGTVPAALAKSRTGVFIGASWSDYRAYLMKESLPGSFDMYAGTGTNCSFLAGRLSFFLGLQGPSLVVDTACSSSLVAVHYACQSLRMGECSLAIAGGVHLMLAPEGHLFLSRSGALAPDGQCKTFSARADGYGRGEGCGAVILKPLSSAIRDRDPIRAVIRGSAVNHDGKSSGLTVPNGLAQERLILDAIQQAEIVPADVTYVEAHGTGTLLGDPIEVEALSAAYCVGRRPPLLIGAAKSNIGHLEAAAGIAGLIKLVLALENEVLPASLHALPLSDKIDWGSLGLEVVTKRREWRRGACSRTAGVSAFGISGTNAHVIVSDPPVQATERRPEPIAAVLPISATSEAALLDYARSYREFLSSDSSVSLRDLTYTAALRRSHYRHRLAVAGRTTGELAEALDLYLSGRPCSWLTPARTDPSSVVFVYPGQGSQHVGMGRELWKEHRVFADTVRDCAEILDPISDWRLLDLFEGEPDAALLQRIDVVQPAIFAVAAGLTQLLKSYGVVPNAVVGHSQGEIAAAYAAGALTLEDAARISGFRSQILRRAAGLGAMALIECPASELKGILNADVWIAGINGPTATILSGDPAALAKITSELTTNGVFCRNINVNIASHTPAMDHFRDEVVGRLHSIKPVSGTVPFYSTVTGQRCDGSQLDGEYWFENVRKPVQFSKAIESLARSGFDLFVEISAHPLLLHSIESLVEGGIVFPTLRRDEAQTLSIFRTLGSLYRAGYPIRWDGLHPEPSFVVEAPTYPFQDKSHWYRPETVRTKALPVPIEANTRYLLSGQAVRVPGETLYYVLSIGKEAQPFLTDHAVFGSVVVPGAFYLSSIMAVANTYLGMTDLTVTDIQFIQPLLPSTLTELHISLTPQNDGYFFAISSPDSHQQKNWRQHATGHLRGGASAGYWVVFEDIRSRCDQSFSQAELLQNLEELGIHWGESWQHIDEIKCSADEAIATLRPPSDGRLQWAPVHPAVIDNCFGVGLSLRQTREEASTPHLPYHIREVRLNASAGTPSFCHWRRDSSSSSSTSANIVIADALGQAIVEINGFVAQRANRDSFIETANPLFRDALFGLQWRRVDSAPRKNLNGEQCVVFSRGTKSDERLCALLANAGVPTVRSNFDVEILARSSSGENPLTVVCLWDRQSDGNYFAEDACALSVDALRIVQACAQSKLPRGVRLRFVTRGAQALMPAEAVTPSQAALWGFSRVVMQEHPELDCRIIDLDPSHDEMEVLCHELFCCDLESQVAIRSGRRHVPRLAHLNPNLATSLTIRSDATYLITGAGALARHCVRWLLRDMGVRKIICLARRGATKEWSDLIKESGSQIEFAAVDVSDIVQLRRWRESLPKHLLIRGVLHTAGVIDDGVLLEQDADRFRRVFAPKASGGWNVHSVTSDFPLDFFVLFSSAAAILGSDGQASYAAANAFLDGLAHYRRALGMPALTLNWGLWSGGGMGEIAQVQLERAAWRGFGRLTPAEGVAILARALQVGETQQVAQRIDFAKVRSGFKNGRAPSILRDFVSADSPPADSAALWERFRKSTRRERMRLVLALVESEVRRVLHMGARAGIAPRRPFQELGLDSLMALQLRNGLSDILSRRLSPTVIFDYPTVESLSSYLLEEVIGEVSPEAITTQCSSLEPAPTAEPVAIVGMACRFPNGSGPESFWESLVNGADGVRNVSGMRWSTDYEKDVHMPRYAGLLDRVDEFDPHFFGISDHEAIAMDPQQRLLLEITWEAFEDAGLIADRLAGSQTGVFVGICSQDYMQLVLEMPSSKFDPHALTGIGSCFAPGRISYLLGLRGPSMAIDTACSSSLVAVHLACESLLRGDSTIAIAGGVNLLLSPVTMQLIAASGGLSPSGRCRPFDRGADGFVRADGCGMVVLKRLSRALEDGDRIWALIRATSVNQDGRSASISAPNMTAQRDLIQSCLQRASVQPGQIGYIEAHGTGTRIGDPIETGALTAVWGRASQSPCCIGSVKANIGHAEAAAGIAGLIKTVLVLHHGIVPKQIHFEQLNPLISFTNTNLAIPTQTEIWKGAIPRIAGISSFGMSGTNAFAVVQAAPSVHDEAVPITDRPRHILTLSAKSAPALRRLAGEMIRHLDRHPDHALPDICFTANTGRTPFEWRTVLIPESLEELRRQLFGVVGGEALLNGVRGRVAESQAAPKVGFMFSGHGSQYFGMGKVLYRTQPVFRRYIDRCAELLRPFLKEELVTLLFEDPRLAGRLDEWSVAQPAIFALEYSLFRLWRGWGLEPDALIGHSLGELAAACAGGVFSLEDAATLVACRSRLMQERTSAGRMAAVQTSEQTALKLLARFSDQVSIAGLNGAEQIVISGDSEALADVIRQFEEQGIKATALKAQVAAHSPLMKTMLPELMEVARSIHYSPPSIPIVSNVTGRLESDLFASPEYWVRQVEAPVRFADGIHTMIENDINTFIEIGPHPVLSSLGKLADCDGKAAWLTSLHRDQDDWTTMLNAAGRLFTLGVNIDWRSFDAPFGRSRVSLPHYPFERKRYWLEPGKTFGQCTPDESNYSPAPSTASNSELPRLRSSPRPPRSPTDEGVAKVCAALIGVEDVDLRKSFFASGGDSLLATRLVARLRSELQVNIDLHHILGARTIEQIAKTVESLQSVAADFKEPDLKRLDRDKFRAS